MTVALILRGYEAIAYAETNGLDLNKSADPIERARDRISVAEAEKIAKSDPSLIWVESNQENV